MNQLVLKATAATVACRLGIDEAPYLPPSAVSATVYDANGAVLVAAAAQTVGKWTLNGSHAAGSKTITVTTSWGTRPPQPGETGLLAAATSPANAPRELVTIEAVTSSTTGTAREDLERAWATGAYLYDTVQRIALTSTHTATLGRNYRACLTVTLLGLPAAEATRTVDTLFDVVAHIPRNPLTLSDLRARAGGLVSDTRGRAASAEGGWAQRLDAAFERVLDDVWNRGLWVDLLVADSQMREAVYWRTLLDSAHLTSPADYPPDTWRADCRKEYDEARNALFEGIKWIDENQDLEPSTSETAQRRMDTWLRL